MKVIKNLIFSFTVFAVSNIVANDIICGSRTNNLSNSILRAETSLAIHVVEKVYGVNSILQGISGMRVLGGANGDLTITDLKKLLDEELLYLDFGDSIQDNKFEAYLKAKIYSKKLNNFTSKSENKINSLNEFLQNYTDSNFKQSVSNTLNHYEQLMQDQFDQNRLEHNFSFGQAFKNANLDIAQMFQSTGKSSISILAEISKIKKFQNAVNRLSLLEENMRGESPWYIPIDVFRKLYVASVQIYNDVKTMVDNRQWSESELVSINSQVSDVLKNINVLMEMADDKHKGSVFLGLLTDAINNIKSIETYINTKSLYKEYLSNYDNQVIGINISNLYIDLITNVLNALNETVNTKAQEEIGTVISVASDAKNILIDFALIGIKIRAMINGQVTGEYDQIRDLKVHFDDLLYASRFSAKYYQEIFYNLGVYLRNKYKNSVNNYNEDTCIKVDTEELVKSILNLQSTPNLSIFPDLRKDSSFNPHIVKLFHKGVINGYEDGTFKPKENVSIGQLLTMATIGVYGFNLLDYDILEKDNIFFSRYAEFLYDLGIDIDYNNINDYTNGSLDKPAKRSYVAKVIANIVKYKFDDASIDASKISGDWSLNSALLRKYCISSGKTNELTKTNYFAPNDNITRDEVSVMISKAMDLNENYIKAINNSFTYCKGDK
jgi:hypothetical protein